MVDFFTKYPQEIITILLSLIASIVTTLIIHFLSYPKLIFEEKAKLIGKLTEKKIEGISELRALLRALSSYEDLSLTEPPDNIIPELSSKKLLTPTVFYDYSNFTEFYTSLNDLYAECNSYISLRATMHIIYIKQFLIEYLLLCKNYNVSGEVLRWLSLPLYEDLKKRYQKIDAILIRELNRPTTKYRPKYGFLYQLYLRIYNVLYNRSKLYRHIYDNDGLVNVYLTEMYHQSSIDCNSL